MVVGGVAEETEDEGMLLLLLVVVICCNLALTVSINDIGIDDNDDPGFVVVGGEGEGG